MGRLVALLVVVAALAAVVGEVGDAIVWGS